MRPRTHHVLDGARVDVPGQIAGRVVQIAVLVVRNVEAADVAVEDLGIARVPVPEYVDVNRVRNMDARDGSERRCGPKDAYKLAVIGVAHNHAGFENVVGLGSGTLIRASARPRQRLIGSLRSAL